MRIVYLRSARSDLDAAYDHIAIDDPGAADRLIEALRYAVGRLSEYPHRAPEWRPGIRKLSSNSYAVIYRVSDDRIEIGRVLHLRRDLDAVMIDVWADNPRS